MRSVLTIDPHPRRGALEPFLKLLEEDFVPPADVERRWSVSKAFLSTQRREQRGLPCCRVPDGRYGRGTPRYSVAEIVAAEILGMSGAITNEFLSLAIATCVAVPSGLRQKLQLRFRKRFGATLPWDELVEEGDAPFDVPQRFLADPALEPIVRLLQDRLITAPELAKRWKMSNTSLNQMRRQFRGVAYINLPSAARQGGLYRYRRAEIRAAEILANQHRLLRYGLSPDEVFKAVQEILPRTEANVMEAHLRELLPENKLCVESVKKVQYTIGTTVPPSVLQTGRTIADPLTEAAALGIALPPDATKAMAGRALPPKYRDPMSEKTWSGYGRIPKWIKLRVHDGYTYEDMLINKPPGVDADPDGHIAPSSPPLPTDLTYRHRRKTI